MWMSNDVFFLGVSSECSRGVIRMLLSNITPCCEQAQNIDSLITDRPNANKTAGLH